MLVGSSEVDKTLCTYSILQVHKGMLINKNNQSLPSNTQLNVMIQKESLNVEKNDSGRVAYWYSGTDRNRDSFRKVPVFYCFIENRYLNAPFRFRAPFRSTNKTSCYLLVSTRTVNLMTHCFQFPPKKCPIPAEIQ